MGGGGGSSSTYKKELKNEQSMEINGMEVKAHIRIKEMRNPGYVESQVILLLMRT